MQKVVNNHLYVFDLTPFEITENTDASVIFVQNECVEGYKELNSDVADKIQGFNQFLLCVQKQEWSQDADDGGGESGSESGGESGQTLYSLTIASDNELFWNQFNVCGRADENDQPSNEGNPTWLTYTDVYSEQNPGHVIAKVYNNLPADYHFQMDERNFPEGWSPDPRLEIDSDDTLWGVGTTWIMPASDTTIRLVV